MGTKILLVMPVPFREVDGQLGFDEQTCEGLVRWAENFDRIAMACPTLPGKIAVNQQTSDTWRSIATLPCADRLELVPLPYAYKPQVFARTYQTTRQRLRAKIREADYLCFAIGALIGDWAGVASQEAIALGRPYAVWADRVEYEVIRRTLKNASFKHRLRDAILLPLMKRYHRYWVREASLGLFQGQDCFTSYAPFCNNPHCVYDVHTQKSDQIAAAQLEQKIDRLSLDRPLKICYVGRAADMKGGIDWLRVVAQLHRAGVNLQATWLGDGPLLSEMKSFAQKMKMDDRVHFGGFVGDRALILETMRTHHVFLFCHKTPESPRCLVEALVSGCPIVGYGSPYPAGLVAQHGGGSFVALNDWEKLAALMIDLNADRGKLSALIRAAARSGQLFDEETVFQHRSHLIKQHLPPGIAL